MGHEIIDLRSDTVTKPTPEMRRAMSEAEVGDDVYFEDPTVERLQEKAAELLGFEASLFMPSGTMGNQVAIKLHTEPGQEVIVEAKGHIFNFEMATMAAVSGVLARPVVGEDGFLTARLIEEHISAPIYYLAQTGLVSLENTHNLGGGRIHPQKQVSEILALCRKREIPVHLDGARLFNAAVASGVSAKRLATGFDSVMFCLSKGLGTPIGSMLCGSRELIERAYVVRRIFGGGMRQVGIIAAAGLYALEHHIDRLTEDHARARKLAEVLSQLPFVTVDPNRVDTNILVLELNAKKIDAHAFVERLKGRGVLCSAFSKCLVRMVTHLDFDDEDLERTAEILRNEFTEIS